MNITELFHFKTILCRFNTVHDNEKCYFFHSEGKDHRRFLIDFEYFLKNSKEEYTTTELSMYSKHPCISDFLDKIIFDDFPLLSKNSFEENFHIENYMNEPCFYNKNELECPNFNFCAAIHTNQIKDSQLTIFMNFFQNQKNKKVKSKDLTKIYNMITHSNNRFIKSEDIKTNEILSIPKKNFLKTYKQLNLLNSKDEDVPSINSRIEIMNKEFHEHSIYRKLKKIEAITYGSNFFENFNKDMIYYISENLPKENDQIKVIFAFLNSHNGKIIVGLDPKSLSYRGIFMNRKERDLFKQEMNRKLNHYINFDVSIKYKFFDMIDSNKNKIEDLCVLIIKVKALNKNKCAFEPKNYEFYKIKDSFIDKIGITPENNILELSNIQSLRTREYVNFIKKKLDNYYSSKFNN